MVKIKDDVDLKELEKFGFEKTMSEYYYCLISNKTNYFWVEVDTRILTYTTDYEYADIDVIVEIYNKLNNAGFVEKVEEV